MRTPHCGAHRVIPGMIEDGLPKAIGLTAKIRREFRKLAGLPA